MNHKPRRLRASTLAKAAGADAVLLTHPPDIRYLSGFTGSSSALLLQGSRATLFTDGRYTTQAREEVAALPVFIAKKSPLLSACEHLQSAGIQRCGFDASHTNVASLALMRKAVPASIRRSLFLALPSLVAALREIKDGEEVQHLRAAAALGCTLFDHMLGYLTPGLTETAVAAELEFRARHAGAEAMSFETIVASGLRSALPHGRATAARLPRRGFLTLDFGVMLNGYCSDMTRTVHFGNPTAAAWQTYEAVLEAQEAAIAAVAPGVTAAEVDEAARSVLRRARLDKYFTHSTGHGVGLEIHEGPRLGKGQSQRLEPGMVLTIEPGVYLPGRFGMRIEDMILVTQTGGEILTPSVKAWTQL